MLRKVLLAIVCAAALGLLPVRAARAQDSAPASGQKEAGNASGESEVPEANYRLKKVALSFYGGTFSGGTFLELPQPWPRTMFADGVNVIYRYDNGLPWTEQQLNQLDPGDYYAPIKKLEKGTQFGGRIGFYLSNEFHADLQFSVASAKATTSFLHKPDFPLNSPVTRVQVDEDSGVQCYMGGAGLAYDASRFNVAGLTPYVGCAFGGIINRFSHLKDKTGLFFQVSGGFYHDFSPRLRASALFSATTFSFTREELEYGKQLTFSTMALGLSYMIDMIPRD